MQNYKKISLCTLAHKDIFHTVVISFVRRLSRSSAESRKRKLPFILQSTFLPSSVRTVYQLPVFFITIPCIY